MNYIGRRIFFDKTTGNVLADTQDKSGEILPTTVEQDINSYTELSERNRETFDYIELFYGQFSQDFGVCVGYRVNPDTRNLEFSYPDPNAPEEPPVYQPPLSEQLSQLNKRQDDSENAILTLMDMQLL